MHRNSDARDHKSWRFADHHWRSRERRTDDGRNRRDPYCTYHQSSALPFLRKGYKAQEWYPCRYSTHPSRDTWHRKTRGDDGRIINNTAIKSLYTFQPIINTWTPPEKN